jgi:hypothetical protein
MWVFDMLDSDLFGELPERTQLGWINDFKARYSGIDTERLEAA